MHVALLLGAVALLAVPGPQAVQAGGAPQYPGEHVDVHTVAPGGENKPKPQFKQASALVLPDTLLNVCEGHIEQLNLPGELL